MIIEKDNRQTIVISEGDRKIVFNKHVYLPEYKVTFQLGEGNGNAAGLKFVRDAFAWVFNNTPCIMLKAAVPKTLKPVKAFSVNIPTEIYGETDQFWLFRCSIQYWMDNSVGYNNSKAEGKRPKS